MNFKKSIVLVFFAMVAVGGIAQQSINGANNQSSEQSTSLSFSSTSGLETDNGAVEAYKKSMSSCTPGTFNLGFITVAIAGMQGSDCKFVVSPMGRDSSMECLIPKAKLAEMINKESGKMVDITPYCAGF